MTNINLNNVRTPLARKVNALYVALAASEDWSDCIGDVTEMLNSCANYVDVVTQQEVLIQNARFRMEGSELRQYIMGIDKNRRALHDGLMSDVNLVNRLCGKVGVPVIAENVTEEYRETYFDFAKEVVDSYFTTGQAGSVSES